MRTTNCSFPVLLLAAAACTPPRAAPVSPADVSELAGRVAESPNDGDLVLRYAAALHSAEQCDSATVVARRGMTLAPRNAVGPLVVGRCLERAERYGDAIAVYRSFLVANPDGRGTGAVRSRELLAARASATREARQALAREQELAAQPADPQTVAVLPLQISGDSAYQPLSRGLAQMLTSDLSLLQRFRMVERLQLGALMDELRLSASGRVDEQTAARVGRLVRAGRLVQGAAVIPTERDIRLDVSVLLGTGEVTTPAVAQGRFRDLLQLEKEVVVGLASRMGYSLSEAERRSVLENGTQNLSAFLAYSLALEAEDRGDYGAAATFYSEAVRQDPKFQAARDGYQAATSAPAAQNASAGDITVVASEPAPEPPISLAEPVATALGSTIGDLAPTQAEQSTAVTEVNQPPGSTVISNPPPPTVVPPVTVTGTIRIIFRLP